MKKLVLLFSVLSVFMLAACSINNNTTQDNKKVEKAANNVVKKVDKTYSDQDVQDALDLVKELLK